MKKIIEAEAVTFLDQKFDVFDDAFKWTLNRDFLSLCFSGQIWILSLILPGIQFYVFKWKNNIELIRRRAIGVGIL